MQLTGLIAAPHTPFNSDFSLNLDCVPKQAAHLAATGVKGAFVGGTTGESLSLTTSERVDLFHAWGEAAKESGITFIAHIGHNSLPDAQALAEAAQAAGAEVIGAMAPTFFKPNDARALVNWFARISEPARSLPFYYYDIPEMTGVTIDTAEFVEHAAEAIPGFTGVKYTNPDREQLRAILKLENNPPDMLWGCDEELLDGLEIGCQGAVGSSYNFAATIYLRVIAAHEAGDIDEAKRWQARLLAMINAIKSHGYMASAKAVMTMVGLDCGPARPPLPQMTDEKLNALRADLETVGFFEWIDECSEAK